MSKETFNIIVVGYGGQGVLTLADVISRAALIEGKDVKHAELHGLAQRGGSLIIHVRFGEKVYSSLIEKGKADLIIALDALEALRAYEFAGENSIFLVNKKIFRIPARVEDVLRKIKKYGKVYGVDADRIAEKLTGKTNYANTFILAYSLARKILPLKRSSI